MNVAWTWINIVLTSHRWDLQQPHSSGSTVCCCSTLHCFAP